MSLAARRLLLIGAPALITVGLILFYRSHRLEANREAERESPVVAASRVEDIQGQAVVVLDSATIRRIGLQLAPVRAASGQAEVRLPAEVVPEPERTAIFRAPLSGRLSLPDGVAWPRLGTRISAGQEIARVSDARPLSSPISGIVTRIEAQPGQIVEAGQVLLEIVDNTHPMVRLAWDLRDGSSPPASLQLEPPETEVRVRARLVGAAPEADPATRRAAYLYRAERRWVGASPGTPVWALVSRPLAGTSGVVIPGRAVVQWEGLAWAYLQRGPGRYSRVPVPTRRPVTDGWLAGPPFSPGDSVVVTGGQELLSEEFRAQVRVGEESGE